MKKTKFDIEAANRELETIRTELGRFAEHQIHHWTNVQALRAEVAEAERLAIVQCQWASGTAGERYDIAAARHRIFAICRDSNELRHFATLRALLAVAESHPDFLEADKFIQPRIARRDELAEAIRAEAHWRLAEADRRAAEQAAAEAAAVEAVRRKFSEAPPHPEARETALA